MYEIHQCPASATGEVLDSKLIELNLLEFYSQKLTVNNAITLDIDSAPNDGLHIVRQLMKLDCEPLLYSNSLDDEPNTEDNDWENFGQYQSRSEPISMHPLDKMILIWLCANDELRQLIALKLSCIQFAIPWILPSTNSQILPCLVWTLRRVACTWKKDSRTTIECPLLDLEAPICSFIRLGRPTLSKSSIASKVLNADKRDYHDYFFSKINYLCFNTKVLSNGMVDFFWYLPSAESTDCYARPVIVLNLHGCAQNHPLQLEQLCAVSDIMFVFVEDNSNCHECLSIILSQSKQTVCLLSTINTLTELKVKYHIASNSHSHIKPVSYEGKNEEQIVPEIKKIIIWQIKTFSEFSCLGRCISKLNSSVDEHKSDILNAKSRAKAVTHLTTTYTKSDLTILQSFLPEISRLKKELRRLTQLKKDTNVMEYKSSIENDILEKKKEQLTLLRHLLTDSQSVLAKCLSSLASLNEQERFFFIDWMNYFLADINRSKLGPLRAEVIKVYQDISTPGGIKNPYNLEKKQRIEKEINDAYYGMEHLQRELVQAIEIARKFASPMEFDFEPVLKFQSQLLTTGHCIEIMDGDSGAIHFEWLDALIQEACKSPDMDSDVCIVSVVGVQSSGKSTLLNTMFGLNFAVDVGKCTKGIYAQLIPLSDQLQQRIGCKFMLLLDTEGLCNPELQDDQSVIRDNEMATFIVGLADFTLLNVYGENINELRDILGIIVGAFLRMKQVDLYPMSLFVQQNMKDQPGNVKLLRQRVSVIEQLDEITKAASMAAELDVKHFCDVIDVGVGVDEQMIYLPDYWFGNHTNLTYSTRVHALRETVISCLERKKRQNPFLKLSDLPKRISDIHEAVLHENFVFTFRNSKEIIQRRRLDEKETKWTYDLRLVADEWLINSETKLHNKQPTVYNALKERLSKSLALSLQNKLDDILQNEFVELFERDENALTLSKWRESTKTRLENFEKAIQEEALAKLAEKIQIKIMAQDFVNIQEQSEKMLLKIAKDTFANLRQSQNIQLTETELQEKFATAWNDWIEQIKKNTGINELPRYCVHKELQNKIQEMFQTKGGTDFCHMIGDKKSKIILFDCAVGSLQKYFSRKLLLSRNLWSNTQQCQKAVQQIDSFRKDVHNYIVNECLKAKEKGFNYDSSLVTDILSQLQKQLDSFKLENVSLKDKFYGYVLYSVFKILAPSLQKLHDTFLENNDVLLHLNNSYRPKYFVLFKKIYSEHLTAVTCAQIVVEVLIEEVKKAVLLAAPLIISSYLMESTVCFPHSKRSALVQFLLNAALEIKHDQAYLEVFEQFFALPSKVLNDTLAKYAVNCCNIYPGRVKQLLQDDFARRWEAVTKAVGKLQAEFPSEVEINTSDWQAELVASLQSTGLELVAGEGIIFEMFDSENCNLAQITQELNLAVAKVPIIELAQTDKLYVDAAEHVATDIIGCEECCPFCGAICEKPARHNLPHFTAQHWPPGLTKWGEAGSKKLVIRLCTTLVTTEITFKHQKTHGQFYPYKKYKQFFPEWDIPPDGENANFYWKWFVANYGEKVAAHYKMESPDVPKPWQQISETEAWASLLQSYYVQAHDIYVERLQPPEELAVSNITPTTCCLSWKKSQFNKPDQISGYYVEINKNQIWSRITQAPIKHEFAKVEALAPRETYQLRVIAMGTTEDSEPSNPSAQFTALDIDNSPLKMHLQQHLIGQQSAIHAVALAVCRQLVGLHDSERPMVFLFLGPRGTGKAELAKQLSSFLHADCNHFIHLHMSEYHTWYNAKKLTGLPPGCIGHEQGGQLTNQLLKYPDAVVLLDKIEKAHPDVLTQLLKLFDEGRLIDGKRNTVNAKAAIIVMTSNLAAQEIADEIYRLRSSGKKCEITKERYNTTVRPILKTAFKGDQLLRRISEVVCFIPFSEQEISAIVIRELEALQLNAATRKNRIQLSWTAEVVDTLARHYDQIEGMPSLKREVEKQVGNLLKQKLSRDENLANSEIKIVLNDSENNQGNVISLTVIEVDSNTFNV